MKFNVLLVCAVLALTVSGCRRKPASAAAPVSTEPPPPSAGVTIPAGPSGTVASVAPGSPEHGNVVMLTFAAQQFYGKNQRMPNDLQELADARLIPKVPTAPAGMRFLMDAKEKQVRLVKQ